MASQWSWTRVTILLLAALAASLVMNEIQRGIRQRRGFFGVENVAQVPVEEAEGVARKKSKGVRKNIILVVADDLRQVPVDGLEMNQVFQRIGGEGTTFKAAYTQYPLCNPSRSSFLTGRNPDTTKVYDLDSRIAQDRLLGEPNLHSFFKENGYKVLAGGKVFHGETSEQLFDKVFEPTTEFPWKHSICKPKFYRSRTSHPFKVDNVPVFDRAMCVMKDEYKAKDQTTVLGAIRELESLTDDTQPFFLSVGLVSTHLPWMTHKKYWSREVGAGYSLTSLLEDSGEFKFRQEVDSINGKDVRVGALSESERKGLLLGYRAAAAQLDDILKDLLDAVERLNLSQTTTIVMTSDHGFSLGEENHIGKRGLDEYSLRVPLVIRCPWCNSTLSEQEVNEPVELIDLYRTLADIAGLLEKVPPSIEGKTLVPFIEGRQEPGPWFATSQVVRCFDGNACPTNLEPWSKYLNWMGYSIRTYNLRYTLWFQISSLEESHSLKFDLGSTFEEAVQVCNNYDGKLRTAKEEDVLGTPFKSLRDLQLQLRERVQQHIARKYL